MEFTPTLTRTDCGVNDQELDSDQVLRILLRTLVRQPSEEELRVRAPSPDASQS